MVGDDEQIHPIGEAASGDAVDERAEQAVNVANGGIDLRRCRTMTVPGVVGGAVVQRDEARSRPGGQVEPRQHLRNALGIGIAIVERRVPRRSLS